MDGTVEPDARRGEWPPEFERMLRAELPSLEPDAGVPENQPLTELGMDSLGIVALISEAEEIFGVELDDRLDDLRLFSTAGYLWKTIAELRAEAEAR